MRGKFLLLFAVVMKTWGLLIILSELLMCRRQGEERYFTTGQAGVIGMKIQQKFCKCRKICKILPNFKNVSLIIW